MNDAEHAREDAKIAEGAYGTADLRQQFPELNRDIDNRESGADLLLAAGGWCAPSETLYDLGYDAESLRNDVFEMITVPDLAVVRGGATFKVRPFTERELIEREANVRFADFVRRHVENHIGAPAIARHWVVDGALAEAHALTEGNEQAWGVWTHEVSWSRFVGITVWPDKRLDLHVFDGDGYDEWGHGRSMDAGDWVDMFEDRY